jgi:hypothetical protein
MVQDGDRRFGRNPLDMARDEFVQHYVAENEDPRPAPLGDPGRIHSNDLEKTPFVWRSSKARGEIITWRLSKQGRRGTNVRHIRRRAARRRRAGPRPAVPERGSSRALPLAVSRFSPVNFCMPIAGEAQNGVKSRIHLRHKYGCNIEYWYTNTRCEVAEVVPMFRTELRKRC